MVWPGGNLSLIFHPCSQTAENRESTWQTIFTACLGLIHNALARTDRQTHSSAAFLITPRPASIRHREPPTPPVDVSRKTGRVPPSFKPNSSVNWRATRLFYFISSPPSYFRFSIFTFAPFGREGREGKRFGEQKEYISTALGKGGHAVNLFKLRAMFQRVQQLLLGRGNRNRAKRAKACALGIAWVCIQGRRRGGWGKVDRWVAPVGHNATEKSLSPSFFFPSFLLSAPSIFLCNAFRHYASLTHSLCSENNETRTPSRDPRGNYSGEELLSTGRVSESQWRSRAKRAAQREGRERGRRFLPARGVTSLK